MQTWNRRRFAAFVRRAEREAKENPEAYRRAVVRFVLLGYGVLYAVAFAVLAVAAVLIRRALAGPVWSAEGLRIGGPGVFLVAFVLLWLRLPVGRPGGRPLLRQEAPRLFAIIDGMARALKVPPPDQVLLTLEMNAALAQTPRYGLLGSHTDMVLGLPLLLLLSPDEVRAVIGHELGHLRGQHSRFGAVVYGLQIAWARLAFVQQATRSRLLSPLVAFAQWYAPRLAARSLAMRREHELAADQASVEMAGAKAATDALVAVGARAQWFVEHFMRTLLRNAAREPTPPADLFERLCRARAEPVAERYLSSVLAMPADPTDSHPPLGDRLRALGTDPQTLARAPLPPPAVSAAEQWMADLLPEITEQMNQVWAMIVEPLWHARQLDIAERKRALSELPADRASSRPALWARALLCHDAGDDRAAVLVLREMLMAGHRDAEVLLLLGLVLAEHGDDRAVEFLEEAASKQVGYAVPALSRALAYARSRGLDAAVERLRPRLAEAERVAFAVEQERTDIGEDTVFEPPALSAPDEAAIRAALQAAKDVEVAYVVRRGVERVAGQPCHWVLIEVHVAAEAREEAIVEALAEGLNLTADVRIAAIRRLSRRMRGRILDVPGCRWDRPFQYPGDSPLAPPGFLSARPLEGMGPRRVPIWVTIFWLSLLASVVPAWFIERSAPGARPQGGATAGPPYGIPLIRFEMPVSLSGRIERLPRGSGLASGSHLAEGEGCSITIKPANAPRLNCHVTVTCGSEILYGAAPGGYALCKLQDGVPIAAFDLMDVKRDGDPWLSYEGRAGRVVIDDDRGSDDGSETVIRLVVGGAER